MRDSEIEDRHQSDKRNGSQYYGKSEPGRRLCAGKQPVDQQCRGAQCCIKLRQCTQSDKNPGQNILPGKIQQEIGQHQRDEENIQHRYAGKHKIKVFEAKNECGYVGSPPGHTQSAADEIKKNDPDGSHDDGGDTPAPGIIAEGSQSAGNKKLGQRGMFWPLGLLVSQDMPGILNIMLLVEDKLIGLGDDAEVHCQSNHNN